MYIGHLENRDERDTTLAYVDRGEELAALVGRLLRKRDELAKRYGLNLEVICYQECFRD